MDIFYYCHNQPISRNIETMTTFSGLYVEINNYYKKVSFHYMKNGKSHRKEGPSSFGLFLNSLNDSTKEIEIFDEDYCIDGNQLVQALFGEDEFHSCTPGDLALFTFYRKGKKSRFVFVVEKYDYSSSDGGWLKVIDGYDRSIKCFYLLFIGQVYNLTSMEKEILTCGLDKLSSGWAKATYNNPLPAW